MIDALKQESIKHLWNGTAVRFRPCGQTMRTAAPKPFGNWNPNRSTESSFDTKTLTEAELKAMTGLDFENVLPGWRPSGKAENETIFAPGRDTTFGVASNLHRTEVSFTFEEEDYGQGLVRRLLRNLAHLGREKP